MFVSFWVGNEELVNMYEEKLGDAGYHLFKLPQTNNRGDAGACRYESLALDISGGHLAAGVASLFIDGVGCGACFQFGPSKSSDSTSLRDIEDLIYKFLVFMLEHSMREKDG
ncbi:putative calcium-binding protein [Glycine max]|nr:putative calcium-binding protein [Glycine max]